MKRFAIAAALCVATAAHADAYFRNGNELLDLCQVPPSTRENTLNVVNCLAYVQGVVDAALMVKDMHPELANFCAPENASAAQLRDVILAYLRKHPENRHWAAPWLVQLALMSAFPCRDSEKP